MKRFSLLSSHVPRDTAGSLKPARRDKVPVLHSWSASLSIVNFPAGLPGFGLSVQTFDPSLGLRHIAAAGVRVRNRRRRPLASSACACPRVDQKEERCPLTCRRTVIPRRPGSPVAPARRSAGGGRSIPQSNQADAVDGHGDPSL